MRALSAIGPAEHVCDAVQAHRHRCQKGEQKKKDWPAWVYFRMQDGPESVKGNSTLGRRRKHPGLEKELGKVDNNIFVYF